MRRSLALRIGTLVLVVFTTTAPAFAMPARDDSPIGIIGRVIDRVVRTIKHAVHTTDLVSAVPPKP